MVAGMTLLALSQRQQALSSTTDEIDRFVAERLLSFGSMGASAGVDVWTAI
jgi:hypothetical protein